MSDAIIIRSFHSIREAGAGWKDLVPAGHHLRPEHLEILERTQPPDLQFIYVMVYQNEVPLGVLYLQHLKISLSHFDGTAVDKPGLGWLKKLIQRQFSDVLICGNIFRIHEPGFYFREPVNDQLVFDILNRFSESSEDKTSYCAVLLKDCPRLLSGAGRFREFSGDVTMELDLRKEWSTMADYMGSLGKKYRQRCKKVRKAGEPLMVKEMSFNDLEENASRIEQLYLNVAGKQVVRIGFVNGRYFAEMKRALGEFFVVKGYYFNGTLIAFSSHIFYPGHRMEIHFIGLDYEYNERFCLYFNILYDGLEMAIIKRTDHLELGRTARVAKASLGARPRQVLNYLYLRRGIPSLAFNLLNRVFQEKVGNEWERRDPFNERSGYPSKMEVAPKAVESSGNQY